MRSGLRVPLWRGGIVGPVLLMAGLSRTDAAAASLLLTLEGVATALLAWLAFREHFDRRIGHSPNIVRNVRSVPASRSLRAASQKSETCAMSWRSRSIRCKAMTILGDSICQHSSIEEARTASAMAFCATSTPWLDFSVS